MLPIVLNIEKQKYVVLGEGEAFQRRRELLSQAGCDFLTNPKAIPARSIVFIAGLEREESERLYQAARLAGALVNTEDIPPLCDFHMPAQVRRGDLLLTVSTGGNAPSLSRILKEHLAAQFGVEWEGRLKRLADKRKSWRTEGKTPKEISAAAMRFVEQEKWL